MLVDTATREGMSGSVVVARHVVVAKAVPQKNGSQSEVMLYAEVDLAVGVYSGRYYPDSGKGSTGNRVETPGDRGNRAGRQGPGIFIAQCTK